MTYNKTKRYRKSKRNSKRYSKKQKKSIKSRKNVKRSIKIKGGTNDECAMCCKKSNDKNFIPNACLMKYGKYKAHKICSDCWWNNFAQEGVNHKCPGCEKKMPLNKDPYENSKNQVIDLTEDD